MLGSETLRYSNILDETPRELWPFPMDYATRKLIFKRNRCVLSNHARVATCYIILHRPIKDGFWLKTDAVQMKVRKKKRLYHTFPVDTSKLIRMPTVKQRKWLQLSEQPTTKKFTIYRSTDLNQCKQQVLTTPPNCGNWRVLTLDFGSLSSSIELLRTVHPYPMCKNSGNVQITAWSGYIYIPRVFLSAILSTASMKS